ncbi:MAG: hypothetical protein IJ174_03500, partial [Clostridia bacterium]|nr:hypothetical protein [Clostridia bacterium]
MSMVMPSFQSDGVIDSRIAGVYHDGCRALKAADNEWAEKRRGQPLPPTARQEKKHVQRNAKDQTADIHGRVRG